MSGRRTSALALRFAVVGVVGFCVDAGLLALGIRLGLAPAAARAVSLAVALHVTFALNGFFVFGALRREALPRQWAAYMAANAAGAACNYLAFLGLTASRSPLVSDPRMAFVGAAAAAMTVNFTGIRFLAFRPQARPVGR